MKVIDEEAGNLGVLTLEEALARAKAKGEDLIEISPNATPPIAKIMSYGKFQYNQKKKQKGARARAPETKSLQIKIGTSEHDLGLKADQASKFLKEGHRVKIDLFLRGRAKYMEKGFLEDRLQRILHFISEEYKIADTPKRSPKGLTVIIEKGRKTGA